MLVLLSCLLALALTHDADTDANAYLGLKLYTRTRTRSQLSRGRLTVGKIYSCIILAENWKANKQLQRQHELERIEALRRAAAAAAAAANATEHAFDEEELDDVEAARIHEAAHHKVPHSHSCIILLFVHLPLRVCTYTYTYLVLVLVRVLVRISVVQSRQHSIFGRLLGPLIGGARESVERTDSTGSRIRLVCITPCSQHISLILRICCSILVSIFE